MHGAYLIAALVSGDARPRIRAALGLDRSPGPAPRVADDGDVRARGRGVGVLPRRPRSATRGTSSRTWGSGLGTQIAAIVARDGSAIESLVFLGFEPSRLALAVAAVVALLVVEHIQGARPESLRLRLATTRAPLRWAAYACAVLTIMTLGVFQSARFIYFQF